MKNLGNDDPIIDTGLGKMPVSEAVVYLSSEMARTPTTDKPWDTSVTLGILKALPDTFTKGAALHVIKSFGTRPSCFESETAKKLLREARLKCYTTHTQKTEYVSFGDLSRIEMGIQCQYGSRYVGGVPGEYPNLSEGLRIDGEQRNYHGLYIHVDDVPTFIQRYRDYCVTRLGGSLKSASK